MSQVPLLDTPHWPYRRGRSHFLLGWPGSGRPLPAGLGLGALLAADAVHAAAQ